MVKGQKKADTKIARLIEALNEGPQSSLTLIRRTGFRSDAALYNAMESLPEVKRKAVDAGCRTISVYWIEGHYVAPPRLSDHIADIEAQVNAGSRPKQAMRDLGLPFNLDSVYRLLRERRQQANTCL